jgi:hypothetical protein
LKRRKVKKGMNNAATNNGQMLRTMNDKKKNEISLAAMNLNNSKGQE